MRARTLAAPIGAISLTAGSILLLGAYFYVFLGAAPVTTIGGLHAAIGIADIVSLDTFFSLGHTVAYCLLTLCFCAIFRATSARPAIAATLTGAGVGIEVLQEEVFGRQFQLADVLANMTGIAAAMILLAIIARRTGRRRRRG